MIIAVWLRGLINRRLWVLLPVAAAIALTVAFAGSLGAFLVFASREVGRRAVANAAIDWQIQLAAGANSQDALAGIPKQLKPAVSSLVGYGDAVRFEAKTDETIQTTGSGKVVGLSPSYSRQFPGETRGLVGKHQGILLAQQTAANLHAAPGDKVTIGLRGRPDTSVVIDGVVDLPLADSFFQSVGAGPGATAQAPPDNVLIVPFDLWNSMFHPDTATGALQLHVRLNRRKIPPDPSRGFDHLLMLRRRYEASESGAVVVADNLASRLDAGRTDVSYGRLLFLFLGLPGIVVGSALAAVVSGVGRDRRRADQAILRAWGASVGAITSVAVAEAALVGLAGGIAGVATGAVAANKLWRVAPLEAWRWYLAAGLIGIVATGFAVVAPAVADARHLSVTAARKLRRPASVRWISAGIPLVVAAGAIVWEATRRGFQVVLAPEGVPSVSVAYWTLLAPTFAWIGGALLLFGVSVMAIGRRAGISRLVRPVAHSLSSLVAGWLSRLRPVVVRSILLLGLTIAFTTSTGLFDRSFAEQSLVDARLTNGADVTAFAPPGIDASFHLDAVRRVSGVQAAEAMQHRFAYVGNDLQDLYGIDPGRIGRATSMSNAYFAGGDAQSKLRLLADSPSGVFVSDETVLDFQLRPGDTIRLRVLDSRAHQYVPIPFRVLGIVREFPTAPTDSFLVANASYVSRVTHSEARETVLVRTQHPRRVGTSVARVFGSASGVSVRNIEDQRKITGSGLVAVDIRGLSLIELAFGAIAPMFAVGLLLSAGFAERNRHFSILRAIGGTSRHVAAFMLSEAGTIVLFGVSAGVAIGGSVGWILIKVLQGVFDPPPDHLAIPWRYFAVLTALLIVGAALAIGLALRQSARSSTKTLRDLAL